MASGATTKSIPFHRGRLTPEQMAERSAAATKLGIASIEQERAARKLGLTEKLAYTLLTAAMTVGMMNGFWPRAGGGGTCGADPFSGLPAELVANCTSVPEGQAKPSYCAQKYVGTITLATAELQSALNSYNAKHGSAIEEARREVVDFYEARTAELAAMVDAQQGTVAGLRDTLRGMEDRLTAKKLELGQATTQAQTLKDVAAAAEKDAKASAAKLAKFEAQLYATTQELARTSEELHSRSSSVKALEAQAAKLEGALSRSESKVLRLQADKASLTEAGDRAGAKLKGIAAQLADVEAAAARLRADKAAVRDELVKALEGQAAQTDRIKKLGEEVEALGAAVKDANARAAAADRERNDTARRLAEAAGAAVTAEAALTELGAEREQLAAALAAREAEVESLRGQVGELEAKIRQQQEALQTEAAAWDAERRGLLGKLERARGLFDAFVGHNGRVQALLVRLQGFLRDETAAILGQTDKAVEASMAGNLEAIVAELRTQLAPPS